MDSTRLDATRKSALDAAIEYGRSKPGRVFAAFLALHLTLWIALPLLLCKNLQLDLAEDLALGREWQLGYWKHPPLPWWAADALYRLTGSIYSVYMLGPLSAVACFYAVWLLARDTVGPFRGLIAVFALEGIHFYNFSVIKFAHDQAQLPFWAFTALFLHRALTRGDSRYWLLAGAFLAGAFWTKYAAFALAAALGLFMLIDPVARRAWRTPGPYLMTLAFLVVIAPNVWWLFANDFMPFRYVDARAREAGNAISYLVYPLRWTAGQLFFLAPAIILLALLYVRSATGSRANDNQAAFDRRYVTMLALGPFAVVTVLFGVLGRLPVAMWGYPLWSFAPLAMLLWWPPLEDMRRWRRFAIGAIVAIAGAPLIYAVVEVGEPMVRDRPKATEFPGQAVAATITNAWRDRFGTPLSFVGGTEFAANNVAVYSPDRPHVVVHGDPALSPWVDRNQLRKRGVVLVWQEGLADARLAGWRATFGDFAAEPALVLPRQSWVPQTWRRLTPTRVTYAFIPPQP